MQKHLLSSNLQIKFYSGCVFILITFTLLHLPLSGCRQTLKNISHESKLFPSADVASVYEMNYINSLNVLRTILKRILIMMIYYILNLYS